MRLLKHAGVAILTALVVTATMSASAPALILPLVVKEQKEWKSKSEGNLLVTSSAGTIECKATKGTGTEEAQGGKHSLGAFHTTLERCTAEFFGSKIACKGLSDSAETILSLGTWHFVYDKLGAESEKELEVGVLFLFESTHFECTALMLFEVMGAILCLVLEYKSLKASHSSHCLAKGVSAEEKEYFNAGDKESNPAKVKLECSINHEAFKECSLAGLVTLEYPTAVSISG